MYGWERLVLLRHLLDEGLTKTDIAVRLGVSRARQRLSHEEPRALAAALRHDTGTPARSSSTRRPVRREAAAR